MNSIATIELKVIIGSTRPGRVGPRIAHWFAQLADNHPTFRVETIDLKEVALPLLDEPEHPALGRYLHAHTRQWSSRIEQADACAFVVPEYNHSFNAATKNAIDYLHAEWRDKPIGFVSYGGVAGGTRAVQALKQVFLALKAVPVLEAVTIPAIASHIDSDGIFTADDHLTAAAESMLNELARRESALRPLRNFEPKPALA